jgi:glycosyltransferase involved in cell wall biosynthesis
VSGASPPHVVFLATEDWYFVSDKLMLARALIARGWRVGVLARVRDHGERIRAEGIELHPLAWRRAGDRPHDHARVIDAIRRHYRRLRPDLVHHVAMKPVVFGSIAARLAGVPAVVNTVNGLGHLFTSSRAPVRMLRPPVLAMLRAVTGRERDRFVLQNADDLACLAALGIARPGVDPVIPGNGVHADDFAIRPEPSGPVTVTFVGRMLRDKGIEVLVAAARRLARDGADVRFRLVGPLDPDNPTSCTEAGLRSLLRDVPVRWEGPRSGIADVWASSHIAVLPSVREGLPRALLEAAACGRPIVATDVAGCRDAVRHGETGLLVPPDDPVALADALRTLADAPAIRRAFGAAGRRFVLERFPRDDLLRRWVGLHETLLCGDVRAAAPVGTRATSAR